MVSLAASSTATCRIASRFQPTAPRLSRSSLLVSRPDDNGGNGGPLEKPVECDLRHFLSGFLRHGIRRIHDLVNVPRQSPRPFSLLNALFNRSELPRNGWPRAHLARE